MGRNSMLNVAFKSIFTVSFAPIWVIFQNSVIYNACVTQILVLPRAPEGAKASLHAGVLK